MWVCQELFNMFRLGNQLIKRNGSSLHTVDLKDFYFSQNFQLDLNKRDTDLNETEP